jgi:hypothetical protein
MSMKSGPPRVLRVHDNDDVAVTLEAIESGATLALDSQPLIVTNDIPKGYKIASRPARNELNDERSIAIWKRGVTL